MLFNFLRHEIIISSRCVGSYWIFVLPVNAEVFIPAGTEMESLNPGAPTFGAPGLETFTDSGGGNGFRFTQKHLAPRQHLFVC